MIYQYFGKCINRNFKKGINRNFKATVDLFRQGAANNDPQSVHNYGSVLLSGKGVKKDVDLAKKYLEKSAGLGYSRSLALLGHHVFYDENNVAKAIEYWEIGWKKYKNPDCAYYLGLIWRNGDYLDQPMNLVSELNTS